MTKLAPVPVDFSKLSDVVKNHVAEKTVYGKFLANVIVLILADLF